MRHAVLAFSALQPLLFASASCVNSWPLLARNAFASSYSCPVNQIEVRPEPGNDLLYRVLGCGLDVTYDCGGTGGSRECRARESVEYEATDGTSHGASLAEDTSSNHAMSREAAVASAAHDLPCDRASLQVVGGDPNGFANVVQGCGQRVTYQIVDADQATASRAGPVKKHNYVVVGRLPLAAPPAPPPAASAPPPPSASPAPPASASAAPPPSASSAPAPVRPPAPAPSASPLSTPR